VKQVRIRKERESEWGKELRFENTSSLNFNGQSFNYSFFKKLALCSTCHTVVMLADPSF